MVTYTYVSPTSHSDEYSTDWQNPTNIYDGNEATFGYSTIKRYSIVGDYPTAWITLIFSSVIYIDRVKIRFKNMPNYVIYIDIWDSEKNQWTVVWADFITEHANAGDASSAIGTTEIAINTTKSDRIRVRGALSGTQFNIYELWGRQVVPDPTPPDPQPQPTNPPVQSEVVQQVKVEQESSSMIGVHGSRMRSKHRRTKFVPVIVG